MKKLLKLMAINHSKLASFYYPNEKFSRIFTFALLTFIIAIGFWFRFRGILYNHSFWSDEALVASLARDIIQGNRSIFNAVGHLNYQPLYLIVVTISLFFFGFTEFAARFPSVIFGTIGIFGVYLVTARLSNRSGGLLAAFLTSFSQLNLAYSTQAKCYIMISTIFFFVLYCILLLEDKKNNLHWVIITLCSAATFIHILGLLTWIPYITYLVLKETELLYKFSKKHYKLLSVIVILLFGISYLSFGKIAIHLFLSSQMQDKGILFPYNNLTYMRELIWKQYGFITLTALFGGITLYKKWKYLAIGIFFWFLILTYLWIAKSATHNVRYLVTLMNVLFVLFSIFWSEVGKQLSLKKSFYVCLLIAVVLYAGGNKFIRKPMIYYSPNEDLYGDIQTANYKVIYNTIEKKYQNNLSEMAIFNNWYDTQRWYLKQKPVTSYFMKGFNKPRPHSIDGVMIYETLDQFLVEKSKYSKGILIVEDWESILPEAIKLYAKKTMKLEFEVRNLPHATNDPWPLQVYSWGL